MPSKSNQQSREIVKVIPLGGLGEIGKNTMVLSCGDDIMLVDAGLGFPNEDMPGVDLVLPDLTYLIENQRQVHGLAITHGHEDHIGGIPYLLKHVTVKNIYGPALALGILESKLREFGLENVTTLHKVKPRQRVQIGCFNVEFVRCTHSIADSFSLVIRTPIGNIIHTGDFKFDFTPVDGELFDIAALTRAAEEGVLLLMSDSTNTEKPGFTPSERTVWKKLSEVFANAPGRIIVTTFASNMHRIKQVLQAAIQYDRQVIVLGRSMLNIADLARELGYMKYPDGLLVDVDEVKNLPDDKIVILTTGSQGEPLSALNRIANDGHKHIKVKPGDTVIFSATPIPGNERSVANTINALSIRGANVIYGKDAGVHVSGHACQEEQKLMINICKPKFFVPIHGEYRMLVKHADLANQCGVPSENTFVMANGDVLALTKNSVTQKERVPAGIVLIDSSRAWEIDETILAERREIVKDGAITITITAGANMSKLLSFDCTLKGIILANKAKGEDAAGKQISKVLENQVKQLLPKFKKLALDKKTTCQAYMHDAIKDFLKQEYEIQPLIQVILHEISDVNKKILPSSKTEEGSTGGGLGKEETQCSAD